MVLQKQTKLRPDLFNRFDEAIIDQLLGGIAKAKVDLSFYKARMAGGSNDAS